jgi:hypothetical protein
LYKAELYVPNYSRFLLPDRMPVNSSFRSKLQKVGRGRKSRASAEERGVKFGKKGTGNGGTPALAGKEAAGK